MNIDKKKTTKRLIKQNSPKQFPLLNLYILISMIVQLIGQMFDIFYLRMMKLLPMALMIFYIHKKNSSRDHLMPSLVGKGLIVSAIGDLCLMINEASAFAIGTMAFFVAHVMYMVAYTFGKKVKESNFKVKFYSLIGSIVVLVTGILNTYTLWDVIPNRILFPSYALIEALMVIFAIRRYQRTTTYSFWYIVVGSFLFGISDNILGFLKFNHIHTDFGRMIIMLTYYAAQFLIMHGSLQHSNLQFQIDKIFKEKN